MVKNLPANTGATSSIPESGRSPGMGNGNSLQYSCQGNPMDTGAWQATVRLYTTELLSTLQASLSLNTASLLSDPFYVCLQTQSDYTIIML